MDKMNYKLILLSGQKVIVKPLINTLTYFLNSIESDIFLTHITNPDDLFRDYNLKAMLKSNIVLLQCSLEKTDDVIEFLNIKRFSVKQIYVSQVSPDYYAAKGGLTPELRAIITENIILKKLRKRWVSNEKILEQITEMEKAMELSEWHSKDFIIFANPFDDKKEWKSLKKRLLNIPECWDKVRGRFLPKEGSIDKVFVEFLALIFDDHDFEVNSSLRLLQQAKEVDNRICSADTCDHDIEYSDNYGSGCGRVTARCRKCNYTSTFWDDTGTDC